MAKKTAKRKPPKPKAKAARPKAAKPKASKSRPAPRKAAMQAKPAAPRRAEKPLKAAETGPHDGSKLTFNHAMVYAKDVARSLAFYVDILGLRLLDEFRYEGKPVYARLLPPGGEGTIALHQAGPGASVVAEGVRLYFEIRELDDYCFKLKKKGIYFTQLPQMMPWGWRHAYLNDPDGHEISIYWAGANRMKKTVMSAGNQAKRNA